MLKSSLSPEFGLTALLRLALFALLGSCNASFAFDSPPSVPSGGMPSAGTSGAGASTGGGASGSGGAMSGGTSGTVARVETCKNDRDCGLPSLHCDDDAQRCVECFADRQCNHDHPACGSTSHTCAECSESTGCGPGAFCDVPSNKCRFYCKRDADCRNDDRCNNDGICQTCDDDDCTIDRGGLFCQVSSGECIQCVSDAACGGQTPRCALPLGRCVACVGFSDCPIAAPFCDPQAHACSASTI